MVQQLLLLSTAVVAILGQTDVPTCGALFSIECQNDSAALLQVALVPDTFPLKQMVKPEETRAKTSTGDSGGPLRLAGPKHQHATVMTSMNDWYSSRDLARVWAVQNVAISPKSTVQIFSAVPVFGKDETYIALLVEHNGDAWVDRHRRGSWTHDFDTFVMFCAGPDGSHKTQVIARGLSWVCPWPREEWQTKRFNVFLEDKNGTNFGMVVAEHDPELLGQYKTMACVRDIFYISPQSYSSKPGWLKRPFSGPFKQWVEWMEWSSMHGLEQFLIYTFEGTDLAAVDLMKPYLDAGIASRVHFQFYHPSEMGRQGHFMNDCIYRAKNHAKWLATSVDVDEYLVFPGQVDYFNWDHILKKQGVLEDEVASLQVGSVRFARARPETTEISSNHREPNTGFPKQIVNVENVYRTSIHWLTQYKNGTGMIKVDPKFAVIHHYRIPGRIMDYDNYEANDFRDPGANTIDETLTKETSMLEAALAKRFDIPMSDIKSFLMKLSQRRPPEQLNAAASHSYEDAKNAKFQRESQSSEA